MAKLLEVRADVPPRPVDTLTRREKTIISYLMQGWRNREISTHLSISEQTVKNHLRTIYDKVGVSDRLELVLYAIHQRLELPPVKPTVPPPL
jgi:DNA-binding NarL/FixJ family response regulator